MEFEFQLEKNIAQLYDDLKNGNYAISSSICFIVLKPKPREIWAANFRDRIVHHLVYNAIKDRFLRRFITDTYSCIPERGTINAARRIYKYTQSITNNFKEKAYYLKADIKNFFVSIDKDILYDRVIKYVPEPWLRVLIKQIIYNDPKLDVQIQSPEWKFAYLPKFKSLWHCPDNKGLPIGNLTSQFFSNIYLNELDQYIKRELKCKYYCRYVDDFVILDKSPKRLNECYDAIKTFLKENLLLDLHKKKKTINLVQNGIDFVGYKIKPNRFYLRKKTIRNIFRAANYYNKNIETVKEDTLNKLFATFNSYLGLLRATQGYTLRKKLCKKITFPYFMAIDDYKKIVKCYFPYRLIRYVKSPAMNVLKEFNRQRELEEKRILQVKNNKKLAQAIENIRRIKKEAIARWGREAVLEFEKRAALEAKCAKMKFPAPAPEKNKLQLPILASDTANMYPKFIYTNISQKIKSQTPAPSGKLNPKANNAPSAKGNPLSPTSKSPSKPNKKADSINNKKLKKQKKIKSRNNKTQIEQLAKQLTLNIKLDEKLHTQGEIPTLRETRECKQAVKHNH